MTDDEALDLFVQRVDELLGTRLVQSGDLRTSFNLKAAIDEPLQFSVHEPDEEALRSFLLTFRQFISNNEPIFIRRVANLLWTRVSSDEIRGHLQRERSRFARALTHGTLQFVTDSHQYRPEEVLDIWINGRYFHNDQRKAKTLDKLDPTSTVFVRQLFLNVLIEATRYIRFVAEVIVIARREGVL